MERRVQEISAEYNETEDAFRGSSKKKVIPLNKKASLVGLADDIRVINFTKLKSFKKFPRYPVSSA